MKLLMFLLSGMVYAQTVSVSDIQMSSKDSLILNNINFQVIHENKFIKISARNFNETICKDKYLTKKNSYSSKDSLFVYLQYIFNDWQTTNYVFRRINFRWQRLSYNLHLPIEDCHMLSRKLGLKHPYLVFLFFRDEKSHPIKSQYLKLLKEKLELRGLSSDELSTKSNKELLELGFKNYPEIKSFWDNHN